MMAEPVPSTYMYKILLVGNSGGGKTELLSRYVNNTFSSAFISTVGIDFKVKDVVSHGKNIKLQIWDTAGQEKYQGITTAYYHGAMGFLVVFDLTDEDSFHATKNWIAQIRELSLYNAQLVMVGNKVDLTESRTVTREQAEELAQSLGVEYYETSAKDGVGVNEVFERLVILISEKITEDTKS